MYDSIFSIITIKDVKDKKKKKKHALKMRRYWLILFRTGDCMYQILSILITRHINGVREGDHTDLQYCLESGILTCLQSVSRWSRRTKHEMTSQVL